MSGNLSQKEYLKKYLSSGNDEKKRKKKKKSSKSSDDRFRIVDDDIDIKNMRPLHEDEIELYNLAEDAPQIAGIIDERPEDLKRLEEFGTKRWKVVTDENGVEDIKVTAIGTKSGAVKGTKYNGTSVDDHSASTSQKRGKPESENVKSHIQSQESKRVKKLSNEKRDHSETDESPQHSNRKAPAVKKEYDSDVSPPRNRRKSSDSDISSSEILRVQGSESEKFPEKPKKYRSVDGQAHHSSKKYDSDESPSRKSQKLNSQNHPTKKSRNQSESDASPPRRPNQQHDSDESPPRKSRKPVPSKLSPQRPRKQSADESPPRRPMKNHRSPLKKSNKQSSDESPPRKSRQEANKDLLLMKSKKQYLDEHSPQKPRSRQQIPSDGSANRSSKQQHESPYKNARKYSDTTDLAQRKNVSFYNSEKSHSTKRQESDLLRNAERRYERKSPIRMHRKMDERNKSPEHRGYQKNSSSSIRDFESVHKHRSHEKQMKHTESNYPSRQRDRQSLSPVQKYGEPSNWKPRQHSPHRRNKSDIDSDISPPRNYSQSKSSSKRSLESHAQGTKPTKMRDSATERSGNESRDHSHKRLKQDGDNHMRSRREVTDSRTSPTAFRKNKERMLDGMKAGLQSKEELKKELQNYQERERDMFAKLDPSVSGEGVSAILRDRKTGKRRNLEQEARDREEREIAEAEHKTKYSRWGRGLKQVEDQSEKLKHDLYEMSKPLARYADDKDLEDHLRDQEREGDPMLEYIRSKRKEAGLKEKPKYQGSYLPNRFSIPPGYRWDGVDRSNGYEKRWFEALNARRAREEEAYKWSTSDM